ncbi:MAG: SDR family NAD(P)-dependent oxidoreductase [Limnospira sp.]
MTEFNNTAVLITGAAGGFGQELTRQLLGLGSRLILSDRDETLLRQRVEAIQNEVKSGEVIACFGVDLSDRQGCELLGDRVKSLNLPIDILINNAGLGLFGRSDEVPSAKWETLMQVNLLAPMHLTAQFLPNMIARKKGHIVNISSVAGWSGRAGLTHYCASKFGLRGFSESLSEEVKPYNIKVTAVYPFFSRTPILNCDKYGTLADSLNGLPDGWLTDPAQVMKATLQGIRYNQLHVFPDRTGNLIHLVKRYAPSVLDKISILVNKKVVNNHKK